MTVLGRSLPRGATTIDSNSTDDVHNTLSSSLARRGSAASCFRGPLASDGSTDDYEPLTNADNSDQDRGFTDMSKTCASYTYLDEERQEELWEEGGTRGKLLKQSMDYYVGRGKSRLQEQSSSQLRNVKDRYREIMRDRQPDFDIPLYDQHLATIFKQAGLPNIQDGKGYTRVAWSSNPNPGAAVVDLAASPASGTIISLHSYAPADANPATDRAYSSTLTWNAWQNLAAGNAHTLKWQVRQRVENIASNNLMSLAHLKYPENVIQDPTNASGKAPLTPIAGYGRFTSEDPAYVYLLAMPNVKTCVQMVMDFNPSMDNPYIFAIHTFPAIDTTTDPLDSALNHRFAYIIIEYGPKPASLTSAMNVETISTD